MTFIAFRGNADPMDDIVSKVDTIPAAMENGIRATQELNEIFQKKYEGHSENLEKFKNALDPAVRDKVNLDSIRIGLEKFRDKLIAKTDPDSLRSFWKSHEKLSSEIQAIKKDYKASGDKPDYQEFLLQKAQKRLATFDRDTAGYRNLLNSPKEMPSRSKRFDEIPHSDKFAGGNLYKAALDSSVVVDASCREPNERDWSSLFGAAESVKFDDPNLWNFVHSAGPDPLKIKCRRIRIGTPFVSYDKGPHAAQFVWKYTIDLVGMNETIFPSDPGTWDLLNMEAQKWAAKRKKVEVAPLAASPTKTNYDATSGK